MKSSKKLKIAIISDLFDCEGGVEILIDCLIQSWKDKYDITLFSLTEHNARKAHDNYHLPTFYIQKNKAKDHKYFDAIYQKRLFSCKGLNGRQYMIGSFRFDAMLALKGGVVAQAICLFQAKKKFLWEHIELRQGLWPLSVFDDVEDARNIIHEMTKVICVSEQIKQSIIDTLGDLPNLAVHYNPIPVERILKRSKEPIGIRLEEKTDKIRFVMTGRICAQKGYDLLYEACCMLEKDGLSDLYEVIVVGGWSNPNDKNILDKTQHKNIQYLGFQENPYPIMKSADWFLSTSWFEGYSISMQEAAVLDIPILATRCSGVPEFLGDSEWGIVMDIDTQDIYTHMKEVILNPALHEKYKDKIIERKRIVNYEERLKAIEAFIEED